MTPVSEAYNYENGSTYGLICNLHSESVTIPIKVVASARNLSNSEVNQNFSCSLFLNENLIDVTNVSWSYQLGLEEVIFKYSIHR